MARFPWIFLMLIFANAAQGQINSLPVGARYLSLGAYSRHFNDVFAGKANAASLAGLKQFGVGAYAERRFNLENMNMYSMSMALPTASGTFGLEGSYFGFSQSNQTQFSLAYGRKLAKTIEIGAAFHYLGINQAGIYGNASAITGSLSLRMLLTEKVTAGINLFNPVRAGWGKSEIERIPARYSFGIGYDASDKFFLSTELEKEEGQVLNINAALQYRFIPQVFVRAGIASQTSNYFAGVGFLLKDFRIDITSSFHPQLGMTPGILLLANIGKSKEDKTETTE